MSSLLTTSRCGSTNQDCSRRAQTVICRRLFSNRSRLSRLATRLGTAPKYPTTHATMLQLAMKGMDLFAKLEYVNPVGSIKDRPAYWIFSGQPSEVRFCEETNGDRVLFWELRRRSRSLHAPVGLRFIPVIDPNIWYLRVVSPADLSHGGESRGIATTPAVS